MQHQHFIPCTRKAVAVACRMHCTSSTAALAASRGQCPTAAQGAGPLEAFRPLALGSLALLGRRQRALLRRASPLRHHDTIVVRAALAPSLRITLAPPPAKEATATAPTPTATDLLSEHFFKAVSCRLRRIFVAVHWLPELPRELDFETDIEIATARVATRPAPSQSATAQCSAQ